LGDIEAEGAFGITPAGEKKSKLDWAVFPYDRTKVPERGISHGRNPKYLLKKPLQTPMPTAKG
jgi:hypothetical protein